MSATWDPTQYARFATQRRQPFADLLALVEPCPGGRVVDLGCGAGELTVDLHHHTGAATTVGVDSSPEMLARSAAYLEPGLSFAQGDIAAFDGHVAGDGRFDVVFANAALQWIDDHAALLPRLRAALAPGGQLAFQVPNQGTHPSHAIAAALVRESPFIDAFGGVPPRGSDDSVLAPEAYAAILDRLGATEQLVRLQIYGHHLASADAVVEWIKGTGLTPVRAGLDDELWDRFLVEYRRRLVAALGPDRPYFYAYRRILARARFE
jgi:trans-aconitate 2-methyltransferase